MRGSEIGLQKKREGHLSIETACLIGAGIIVMNHLQIDHYYSGDSPNHSPNSNMQEF